MSCTHQRSSRLRTLWPVGALLAGISTVTPALAQDYMGIVRQQMQAMDQTVARGQQMSQQLVQQRMQDPAVQQAWQHYLQQTGGRPAMDYPTFTYQYIYTNGFSAQGMAHARANEARNRAKEQAAWQDLRQAQAERAQVQSDGQARFHANQREAGRQLMGQSTYVAPNGQPFALPHTWQNNSTHQHQGQTYRVDGVGQYHILGTDGYWYPMQRPR